jgi:hypothetical protein
MSIHTKARALCQLVQEPLPRETNLIKSTLNRAISVIKNPIISYLPNNPNKSQSHNQKSLSCPLIPSMTNQLPYDANTSCESTTITPNHLLTTYQTSAANTQCKNK